MIEKSKNLCSGCAEDYYNYTQPKGCWMFESAKIVTRYKIGWWVCPDQEKAFEEVEVLDCYNQPGVFAFFRELPDFAVDPIIKEKE